MAFQRWHGILLVIISMQFAGIFAARKIPITESCPLCDFVYHDDGVFDFQMTDQWDLSTNESLNIPVQTYVFNMTSTKYFDNGVSEPVWWHTVIINIPENLQFQDKAFLMLTGLQNTQLVDQKNKDLVKTAEVAAKTGSLTAAVYHIPNDLINFLASPTKQALDSDQSLAFSQILFYKTKNPNLLLQAAMTKVAVKAMDLIQSPGIQGYTSEVKKFTVAGESKRGWVTWLVGAIDDRVEALIPATASSFMKQDKNVHLMIKSYGGYSFYHVIPLHFGVFKYTDSEESRLIAKVTDPLSYRDYLDMPKLVVVSASDDVFMPDATKFWFDKMPGDNKLWVVENIGHFLELYPNYDKYWEGVGAYYEALLKRYPTPHVSWKLISSDSEKTGTIKMFTSHIPKAVRAFYAKSVVPDRRDFRAIVYCPTCDGIALCDTCSKLPIKHSGVQWISDTSKIMMNRWKVSGTLYKYTVTYDFPDTGYLAFFMQMVFDGPGGTDMTYTSEMNIIPNTFPHPDCQGSACGYPTIPLV